MNSKTLIGVAIASTFAWAAAVQAGAGHQASSTALEEHQLSATASQWESDAVAMEPHSHTVVLLDPDASDTFVVLDDDAYAASTYDVILLPGDFVYFAPNARTSIE